MELALKPNWYETLNPKSRASWDAFQKRKEEGKLQLWERVKLGEILPNKVYMPVEFKDGMKCELCGDIGYRHYWENGVEMYEECECFNKIQFDRNMKKSGANPNMTFENWHSSDNWQTDMGAKAVEYAYSGYLSGKWFFAGGQVGCGKTHICTAILHELIRVNLGCRYMAWRNESVELKSIINTQHDEYSRRVKELCNAHVLYIDDLWKTQKGMKPTQADVNLAFSIINHRYQNKNLVTIISCEYTAKELMKIDEAVGSRIFERSNGFRVEIDHDEQKNYRLKMG